MAEENAQALSNELLITMTSDIVASHVSNNQIGINEVSKLIGSVFAALSEVGSDNVEEPKPDPAVSVRSSVKKDRVTCLDCGKSMKILKRHLSTEHDMTPEEYRAKWGLAPDHPLVAPNYAETRRTLAKQIGLGRKPGERPGKYKKRKKS